MLLVSPARLGHAVILTSTYAVSRRKHATRLIVEVTRYLSMVLSRYIVQQQNVLEMISRLAAQGEAVAELLVAWIITFPSITRMNCCVSMKCARTLLSIIAVLQRIHATLSSVAVVSC
jgi:hypothetical protein